MRHTARGMSLIELVIAIVILGVGVAGVLAAFQQATRASADPLVHKQMLAIAEQMLEETMLRSYAPQPNGAMPSNACARDTFNDLGDYHGYSSTGICDLAGNAIDELAGYTVAVSVAAEAALDGVPLRRIEVSVTHGGEALTLTSYRSGWAQ